MAVDEEIKEHGNGDQGEEHHQFPARRLRLRLVVASCREEPHHCLAVHSSRTCCKRKIPGNENVAAPLEPGRPKPPQLPGWSSDPSMQTGGYPPRKSAGQRILETVSPSGKLNRRKLLGPVFADRLPESCQQLLVVGDVVPREQNRPEH